MREVSIVLDDVRIGPPIVVGNLVCDGTGAREVVRFAYSRAWLDANHAFPIDPELPLSPGDHFPGAGTGLFGIFRDTAPDRWGRVLMERREALDAKKQARKPQRLGEWDFLLGVSDTTRMGALRLREPSNDTAFLDSHELGIPPATRLRELQAIASNLDDSSEEEQREYESWVRQLVAPGSSLGGARPKASFAEVDQTLWIAKFPARDDRHDVGAWEYFAHDLAMRAKVDVPSAKRLQLGPRYHTFCVKRFDRVGTSRRLYASAMTLLSRIDGSGGSYLDIAEALQDHGNPNTLESDLEQMYRRVLFNVLIGNRDDHLRNHGFLRGSDGWTLAPAFDVNPNLDKDEHALTLDETSAVPSVATVRATRELYRLSNSAAARVEREVRDGIGDWTGLARSHRIQPREIERLSTVIDPSLP